MCSYNRINGNYSCGNNETLNTDYKVRAGFEGWVMSDWGATHSMSINRGLDQEMPGGGHMGLPLLAAVKSGEVSMAKIDDSVSRILTQMYKFGLFDHISQWNGTAHQNDVTSLHNSWLARNISAASTVLLKNNGILPLKPGKKIVLIGADALSPFVHGGGSGSVQPTYTISPFSAIQQRNAGKRPASGPGGGAPLPPVKCTVMDNHTDYYIGGSARQPMKDASVAGCCNACGDSPTGFSYFTFTGKDCWCHKKIGQKRNHAGYVSGACRAVPPPGPPPSANDVTTATGTGADAAAAAADVAVVFIHTTSSEGSDRKSLSFADADNAMVEAVAKAQKNTVVVMVNPGAVLTPWTGSVAAALTMFMPGLEMGNAISDVL
jgi:beta-glucosidase